MEEKEFERAVRRERENNPVWFGLECDGRASERELVDAERELDVGFPMSYRSFLKQHGGGFFALGNIFSVAPGSDWNVVARNQEIDAERGGRFLAISDDGTGGFYGFAIDARRCVSGISYLDAATASHEPTSYSDLYAFLVAVALTN